MTLRRSTFLCLLAVAGCDAGDSASTPTPDAGADAQPEADQGVDPEACRGAYVVTAVSGEDAPCPANAVRPGDRVVVEGGRVTVGGLDLAVTAASPACVVEATGCTLDAEAGDRTDTRATLDADATTLTIETERAVAFTPEICPPLTLTLAPADACALDGAYTLAAPLELVAGQCDLSWPEGEVFVDTASPTPTVRVGHRTYDVTHVDPATCTVEAQSGLAIYNDVARTTRLRVQRVGDALTLRVDDALDGTSRIGETCTDAQFEGPLTPTPPAPALEARCDALPFVCGDGICAADAGENCGNCAADCGCEAGNCTELTVDDAPTFACTTSCTFEPCGPAQRCVPAEEFRAFFHTGQPTSRICVDALGDDVGVGGDCDDSRRCAPGLMCARNILPGGRCLAPCDTVDRDDCRECWPITADPNAPIELCRPRCGPGVESACGDSACASFELSGVCSQEGDHGFCQPRQLVYECRPEGPGYGEACAPGGWCGGVGLHPQTGSPSALGCVREGCVRVDDETVCDEAVCSQPCEVDADCPEPLGRCSIIETPRGPSKWCRAPR